MQGLGSRGDADTNDQEAEEGGHGQRKGWTPDTATTTPVIIVIRRRLLLPFARLATDVLQEHNILMAASVSSAPRSSPVTSSQSARSGGSAYSSPSSSTPFCFSAEMAGSLRVLYDVVTVAMCMEVCEEKSSGVVCAAICDDGKAQAADGSEKRGALTSGGGRGGGSDGRGGGSGSLGSRDQTPRPKTASERIRAGSVVHDFLPPLLLSGRGCPEEVRLHLVGMSLFNAQDALALTGSSLGPLSPPLCFIEALEHASSTVPFPCVGV